MFFQSIYQMITAGTDLNISIRKVDNSLSVAVMPRRNSLKEDMRRNMVPLVVNGTPAELDSGFLQAVVRRYRRCRDCLPMRRISRNRRRRQRHRPGHPRPRRHRQSQRRLRRSGKRRKSFSRRRMTRLPPKDSPRR